MGASSGLGFIWNPKKVDMHYLEHSCNWMCARVKSLKSDLKLILLNVYGPKSPIGKRDVWDELSPILLSYKDSHIVIGEDFNTIVSLDEKVGGLQHLFLASLEFKEWIDTI